ncbi:MAG: Rsd/AlgQ family anti-sigma factor [Gammaproteobacteria bacterium]
MIEQQVVTGERRVRSVSQINRIVDARNEMLALFSELIDKRPFVTDSAVPMLVQQFCQALVDYTAHAHFQLYRHFAENRERRVPVSTVADQIYPRILTITQTILDFNDKYDCEDHCESLANLDKDLSALGEHLADRIELEDKLIAAFVSGTRPAS